MAEIIFPTSVTIPLILKQTTINNGFNNAQFSSTLAILLLSLGCLLSINPALAKPADGDDEGEEGDDDGEGEEGGDDGEEDEDDHDNSEANSVRLLLFLSSTADSASAEYCSTFQCVSVCPSQA